MAAQSKKKRKPAPKAKAGKGPQPPSDIWAMMYCFALSGSFSPADATEAANHGLAAFMAKFSTADAVGQ